MQSSFEARVGCLEQQTGAVNRVAVVFDDAPVPDDKSKPVIPFRFIDLPVTEKEQNHES